MTCDQGQDYFGNPEAIFVTNNTQFFLELTSIPRRKFGRTNAEFELMQHNGMTAFIYICSDTL